jgi:hypothetical protein
VVENTEFAAFTRRILYAYARRVAAGDIEALRSMTVFVSDVDAATRQAISGLRECGYSWSEIAGRIGVAKQSAQERYGKTSEKARLDPRLSAAGMAVTVDLLVQVFRDHYPGPRPRLCPGCGWRYADRETDCPTNATVRRLLVKRRFEDRRAFNRLTGDQQADVLSRRYTYPDRPASGRDVVVSLLDLITEDGEV